MAKEGTNPILKTYLIMERINPPLIPAYLLKQGVPTKIDSLSELGIASILFTKNLRESSPPKFEILENSLIGNLLRTKQSHSNEGGVNAGHACIDNPFLVSNEVFEKMTNSEGVGTQSITIN